LATSHVEGTVEKKEGFRGYKKVIRIIKLDEKAHEQLKGYEDCKAIMNGQTGMDKTLIAPYGGRDQTNGQRKKEGLKPCQPNGQLFNIEEKKREGGGRKRAENGTNEEGGYLGGAVSLGQIGMSSHER